MLIYIYAFRKQFINSSNKLSKPPCLDVQGASAKKYLECTLAYDYGIEMNKNSFNQSRIR